MNYFEIIENVVSFAPYGTCAFHNSIICKQSDGSFAVVLKGNDIETITGVMVDARPEFRSWSGSKIGDRPVGGHSMVVMELIHQYGLWGKLIDRNRAAECSHF